MQISVIFLTNILALIESKYNIAELIRLSFEQLRPWRTLLADTVGQSPANPADHWQVHSDNKLQTGIWHVDRTGLDLDLEGLLRRRILSIYIDAVCSIIRLKME